MFAPAKRGEKEPPSVSVARPPPQKMRELSSYVAPVFELDYERVRGQCVEREPSGLVWQ